VTEEESQSSAPLAPSEPATSDAPSASGGPATDDDAPTGSPDGIFDGLWKRVVERWDEDKPHQAILKFAIDTQRLPDLAGRYRKLKDDPAKEARAQKKIDGIVIAATQMLMSMKTTPRPKIPWQWTASVAVVCFLVLIWLTYKVVLHRH
jgi:hypothetical protein